jgi:hypothetical protein
VLLPSLGSPGDQKSYRYPLFLWSKHSPTSLHPLKSPILHIPFLCSPYLVGICRQAESNYLFLHATSSRLPEPQPCTYLCPIARSELPQLLPKVKRSIHYLGQDPNCSPWNFVSVISLSLSLSLSHTHTHTHTHKPFCQPANKL